MSVREKKKKKRKQNKKQNNNKNVPAGGVLFPAEPAGDDEVEAGEPNVGLGSIWGFGGVLLIAGLVAVNWCITREHACEKENQQTI